VAPQQLDLARLNRLYTDAEAADREIFSEMKSNVLLIAGEHYSRKSLDRINERIRTNKELTDYQKLRLTKNHVHKIVRHYVAQIIGFAPGVSPSPKNPSELSDQKAAELCNSVWLDAKQRYKLHKKVPRWARSFIGLGEVCVMLKFDPNKGEIKGYAQAVDPETQEPLVDEQGQPLPDENQPVRRGEFLFEEVYGFNLLRRAGGRDMETSVPWIVRKMVDLEDLKRRYAADPEKLKAVTQSSQDDFIVFDQDKSRYERAQGQVLVREYYWPPGTEDYEEGYFAITTKDGILEEGPLPFGIWPFVWAPFDEYPTTARGRAIVKQLRPYTAEINRASSQLAMQQITLGDDKVIYQAGTKLSPGSLLPGVRGVTYQGAPPQILAGRDGGQYLPYIQAQISEMYSIAMMQEENEAKTEYQLEPYTMLFRSMKQSKKFAEYGEKFENFLVELCELYLTMAKRYLDDDEVIAAVGKNEQINIPEFKNTTPLNYEIKVEPKEETIDSQFGRQLALNHVLQYVGPQLSTKDIGKVIKNMPYGNVEGAFDDLTVDFDNARNDMLQLDKGVMPEIRQYENHEYLVQALTTRTKKPDFAFLPDNVRQAYDQAIQMHEQALAEQQQKIQDAKNEYIPTNGAMIATDLYVTNPKDPSLPSKRVRIPYQALDWLVNQLEVQGQSLNALEAQNQQVQSEVAGMTQPQGTSPQPPPQSGMPQNNAPESALGVS